MVRGGLLSSNKDAPTMEGAFTERNDGVDYSQNFDEAYKDASAITDMIPICTRHHRMGKTHKPSKQIRQHCT